MRFKILIFFSVLFARYIDGSYSSGIEDNPTVFYQLIRGSTDQTNKYDTFYLQQKIVDGWTYADIKVNQPLDYERIKEYNLTVRVEVNKYVIKITKIAVEQIKIIMNMIE